MALYRNIAGIDQIGFTRTPGSVPTIQEIVKPLDLAFDQLKVEKENRYDWLMSHSAYEVAQAGYYVTPDNGSIFGSDKRVFIAIQDIQDIENRRGTAGALLMHLNEPILAKDTAGFSPGSSASGGATVLYSQPIPEVSSIPAAPTGENIITDYNPPTPPEVTSTPINSNTAAATPTNTLPSTVKKNNTLPLITVAGLAVIALAGNELIKRRPKLFFVGGLGLLYYTMQQNKTL